MYSKILCIYKIHSMTAMGYGLNGLGSVPGRARFFSSAQHPDLLWGPTCPYPMGTRAPSLGVKWPGHEADNSPLPGAKVKNGAAITPLPHMS
jgi:hypothetical protein